MTVIDVIFVVILRIPVGYRKLPFRNALWPLVLLMTIIGYVILLYQYSTYNNEKVT